MNQNKNNNESKLISQVKTILATKQKQNKKEKRNLRTTAGQEINLSCRVTKKVFKSKTISLITKKKKQKKAKNKNKKQSKKQKAKQKAKNKIITFSKLH